MMSNKKIYFCGIGGIGVSALAKLYLKNGAKVFGSDLVKSEITEELEKLGIQIHYEQKKENISKDIDFLVYSPAVVEDHPERQHAAKLGIEQKSYPQVLGDFSKLYKTIAVSGTNGKSTTTAILSHMKINAKLDPTVIVGSKLPKMGGNFRAGKSDYFLIEACEYRAHMLEITPRAIILTNIEEDHLDYYRDIDHIKETFQTYINKLDHLKKGTLVVNADDFHTMQLNFPDCQLIKYGINNDADVRASNIVTENGRQSFDLIYNGDNLGRINLRIPGQFNIYNTLAATAYALSLNIKLEVIKKSLEEFTGIWRRFEIIKDENITVVTDYAHHPTAVKSTLQATKEFYDNRRVIAVFQPHQKDRTHKFFNQFVASFDDADVVILPEIFDVTGREDKKLKISSRDLVKEMKLRYPDKKILFAKNLNQAVDLINFNVKKDDVVLVMGAGSVYGIVKNIQVQK